MEPKTDTSVRTVVLPRLAVRFLREHRTRQNTERLTLSEAWQDHGLVFASSVGTPLEPAMSTAGGTSCAQRLGWTGYGFTTCGMDARLSCSPQAYQHGRLWTCLGTPKSGSP